MLKLSNLNVSLLESYIIKNTCVCIKIVISQVLFFTFYSFVQKYKQSAWRANEKLEFFNRRATWIYFQERMSL